MGRTPFLHNGERSSSLLFLILNILFFLTFFVTLDFLFFFEKETPKREKNREALSLVIITYRDILFLYDGFTLIPSSFSIFLFLFLFFSFFYEKRKPGKENQ
jgi:hypothetical protein